MSKGERLRELRERIGLSQVEAAEKIGVSKQTLYKYEKDIITNIPSDIIMRIADVYDSTPAYIFGWHENKENENISDKISYITKNYNENQIKRAFEFIKAFLESSPERQKIALEILQSRQDDS